MDCLLFQIVVTTMVHINFQKTNSFKYFKALKGKTFHFMGMDRMLGIGCMEDHVDALIMLSEKGTLENYCIGGSSERTNKEVQHKICDFLDEFATRNSHIHLLSKMYKIDVAMIKDTQLTQIL